METAVKKIKPIEKKEGGASEEKEPIFEIKTHKYHENPKVSVIVPVYKVDKYLTQCLNSIVNQTMEELEIIIVDEGDQDRCREIIDFFEKNDPRIVAPHQKNGGYGASCNLGMDMARGEYIAIVESDDYIEPEMYEEMYEYAKALDADVVKTPYYDYYSDGRYFECAYHKKMKEVLPNGQCFSAKEFGEILEIHPSVWSAIYRREYMNEKSIRFVEVKGSYVDCGFRIVLLSTNKIAWLAKPYYYWRIDSIGSSVNTYKLGQFTERWKEFLILMRSQQADFDQYYLPHLIWEFIKNLIDPIRFPDAFHRKEATVQECRDVEEVLSLINPKSIMSCKELPKVELKKLIAYQQHPGKLYQETVLRNRAKKIGGAIKQIVDILSDSSLLFWLFVGYLSSLLAINISFDVVQENFFVGGLRIASSIFFGLILLCFFGKLFRKLFKATKNMLQKVLQRESGI